jgi:hypothetical protein
MAAAGYTPAMPDSLALPALAFLAAGLIALALVWPQGEGARSPGPFGHPLAALARPLAPGAQTPLQLRGPEPASLRPGERAGARP